MRLTVYPECEAGNHKDCPKEHLAPPGFYGGSRCTCVCHNAAHWAQLREDVLFAKDEVERMRRLIGLTHPPKLRSEDMKEEEKLKEACRIVENTCRSIGKNCQVQFLQSFVTVAPPSWSGESSGATLYDAIKDAQAVE